MIGILFVGIVAYPKLPIAPLPEIDFPTIQVSAQLPGASPDTMASAVAQPLETQFAQIPGVAQMTSISTLGSTSITVQFDLDRNIDGASSDIQAAINAAGGQLPKNLPSPPSYRKVNPADSPILLLAATSATLPITEVDGNVETKLAQRISQISGVAQVTVGGQQKACGTYTTRPGEARSEELIARRCAHPTLSRDRRQPERRDRRCNALLHDLRR
jgi:hydrophobic/amphiphilic exporter-1 (mainly G- bacteria), HAE1 family